jgi:hypothetical protein
MSAKRASSSSTDSELGAFNRAAMIKMVTGSLLKQLEAYISHKNMFIPQARLNCACGIFWFCKNNCSHQMNIYIHKRENAS